MMAPVIAVVYATADRPRLWTAVLYAAACATDVIDGYIARRYNAITNLGRILDPMGDKLMAVTVMGCLAVDGRAPMWIFLALFAKNAKTQSANYININTLHFCSLQFTFLTLVRHGVNSTFQLSNKS